jgi:site-specific DNA-methyltransferase (adenine-specific)
MADGVAKNPASSGTPFFNGRATVSLGDAVHAYPAWDAPTVIVADGPYGLGSFPGDPFLPDGLAAWYEPHAKAWYEHALPSATLWFWNSEQGWANCHATLEACGWEFRNCHIWDKGMAHVAGNCNTQTLRKYPVVTEVCAQYTRKNRLMSGGKSLPLREWLRAEWVRSGLPLSMTNQACGVKNAATRKYFTADHLWYFPPPEAFARLSAFANTHGRDEGRPYFSLDGKRPMSAAEWGGMRAKFVCDVGVSNVWRAPAVRGHERLKAKGGCVHANQKPLALLERIIRASSDAADVVWEPFGGLCSATLAAVRLGRKAFAAEINPVYYQAAGERLTHEEDANCLFESAIG